MKKVLAVTLSLVLTLLIFPVSVLAEDAQTEPDYGEVIPLTQEEIDAHLIDESIFDNPTGIGDDLPLSVDHSTSNYFPVIDSQGDYGSCVAWSSVYYMYTYEVNRLHGTSAKTTDDEGNVVNNEQNVYSPTWTYSLMALSSTKGISRSWVFDFSTKHGQLPLAHCPQYDSTTFPFRSLPTNRAALVNALSTRISGRGYFNVDTSLSSITSPSSSTSLDVIKRLLKSGYVLGVDMCWVPSFGQTSDGEHCVYRIAADPFSGHAVTIVGYDDTIWCDINDNNVPEDAEYGAFKIANSWGADAENHNQGYIWLSYDALNLNTAVSGDWENDEQGVRTGAFAFNSTNSSVAGSGVNVFTFIQVQDYKVNYACVATYNAGAMSGIQTRLYRSGTNGEIYSDWIDYGDIQTGATNFACMLAFDYSSLAYPISNYLSGYTWKIGTALPNRASITDCVMVDNLNNTIKNYTYSADTSKWECALNLALGDLDYDGSPTMYDALSLYQYVNGNMGLSNVQVALGDVNADGITNATDAMLLYQQFGGARMAGGNYADFVAQMEALLAQSNIS